MAALVAGVGGSAHCVGMCGGLSGLYAARQAARSLQRDAGFALLYNVGRLASYAMLGALAGSIGHTFVTLSPAAVAGLRIAAGALIVLVGLQIAFDLRPLRFLESAGARLWASIAPVAGRLLPVTTLPRAAGLGLLWGLLPCGLVYSALLLSMTAGNAGRGALVMAAFGLGTLPTLLTTGIAGARLGHLLQRRGLRTGLGVFVVAIGLATLWLPSIGIFATPSAHVGH